MSSNKHSVRQKYRWGFSLVELLVTITISTLIASAVLVRFNAVDSVVILKTIAYEIALTLREAQVYAVSATGDTGGAFESPYGVHFSIANPQDYIFFEDNGNLTYDGEPTDTILETYTMNSKYQITDLCVGASCGQSSLTAVFERPEFDANLTPAGSAGSVVLSLVDGATITFTVTVGSTGQISVSSP